MVAEKSPTQFAKLNTINFARQIHIPLSLSLQNLASFNKYQSSKSEKESLFDRRKNLIRRKDVMDT